MMPSSAHSPLSRPLAPIRAAGLTLMVIVWLAAPWHGVLAASEEPPEEVRAALVEVLQRKVKDLLDEKDASGQPYRRGSFSKRFEKIDGSTYKAAFHRDTASADRLLTERFALTLKRDAGTGKWAIAGEELMDKYDRLARRVPGTDDFGRFESFNFDREGMKVTASGGSLFRSSRDGKVEGIVFVAHGLRYEFIPPERKLQRLYDKLKKDSTSEVLFEPEYGEIECDPTTCEEILATAFTGLSPANLDSAGARLRDKHDEVQKDLKKERKDNPFGGFQLPTPPERRFYRLSLAKDSPKRRIGIEHDNWEPREVSYWVYALEKVFPRWEKVYHYDSEATRRSGVDPHQIEMRDDPYARHYDLLALKGTVELATEEMETLSADLTYTIRTKRALKEIPFFILRLRQTEDEKRESKDPQLIINSIEDKNGREMTWVKLGPSYGLVALPEVLPAGTTLDLRVQFVNKAGIYALTSTFSYVSRFGWMPFVRFTDPITDFDLTIKVPARYKALGIGKRVSESTENGIQTTRWVADSPVEFPSIIFGDYHSVESRVKATKADGTAIPVWIHVDKLGKLQGAEKQLENLADQGANSLNLFRDLFGVDYPYGKLDIVNDPMGAFYGQSPSSLIYLGNYVFLGSAKAGALLDSGRISKFNREVMPHEVGHQWWGSLIPNHNDSNYWFVESLAEYASAIYVEASEGHKAYQDKVAEWRREVLQSDLLSSVQDATAVWSGTGFRTYQAAIYNKGPYAFHILRMTYGEEKVLAFLKQLAQSLRGRPIVTRDIQKAAERSFGENLELFFDQWVRGVGQPEYTFTHSIRPTEDGKFLVEGTIEQRILVGTKKDVLEGEYFTALVPITVLAKSGKEFRVPVKVSGPSTPFRFKIDERPKSLTLNKYGESLAYDVIVKTAS